MINDTAHKAYAAHRAAFAYYLILALNTSLADGGIMTSTHLAIGCGGNYVICYCYMDIR